MNRPVLFPDAVAIVIGYLVDALPTVPIHRQVPDVRPTKWVRVIRTGGVQYTPITEAAQITVEAWSDSAADAADLAQLARAHLNACVGVIAHRVDELAGPADLPDVESQQRRYTWSVLVHLPGVAI
jgi:hypothetical protein